MSVNPKKAARHFKPNTFLNRFFASLTIESVLFEKEDNFQNVHFVRTETVIEHIARMRGAERKRVEADLRALDFSNGDLNGFFDHLAGCIAQDNGRGLFG